MKYKSSVLKNKCRLSSYHIHGEAEVHYLIYVYIDFALVHKTTENFRSTQIIAHQYDIYKPLHSS